MSLSVAVFGTSWWVDAMYLPALTSSSAEVVAIAGRRRGPAESLARTWNIDRVGTTDELLDDDSIDAIVIATPDSTHRDLAVAALERGRHVLCEKPLAPDLSAARDIADAAHRAGTTTLVPFTYRYMPTNQWVRRLLEDGYVGRPLHLGMRYFTGFARDGAYSWRFDHDAGGRGVLNDLGSHWLHLARWLLGDVVDVAAASSCHVDRDPRPDGTSYRRANDLTTLSLRFASGATATLEVMAIAHEGDGFGQRHDLELFGTDGTIHAHNDWRSTQQVFGLPATSGGPLVELPIPDDIWGEARREQVHDTYRDVFRRNGAMIGEWVDAATRGLPCDPDIAEGLKVQELLDAAERSEADGGRRLAV